MHVPIQVPLTTKLFLQPIEPNFESDLTLRVAFKAFPALFVSGLSQCNLELLPNLNVFVKRSTDGPAAQAALVNFWLAHAIPRMRPD